MDSSRAGNLRSDRARLHGRSNDPLLLRSRPTSASLHRRDHFNNLRLGHRSSPRITPSTCPNDSALQGGPHRVLTSKHIDPTKLDSLPPASPRARALNVINGLEQKAAGSP